MQQQLEVDLAYQLQILMQMLSSHLVADIAT
jgi:hypothetical protein